MGGYDVSLLEDHQMQWALDASMAEVPVPVRWHADIDAQQPRDMAISSTADPTARVFDRNSAQADVLREVERITNHGKVVKQELRLLASREAERTVETRELLQQLNESSFMAAQLQDCLIGATAQLEAAVAHCNQMQKQIESLQQAEPTAANREE